MAKEAQYQAPGRGSIEEGKRVPAQVLEQREPGTSMGGARPKAAIEDGNRLWIGKYPEKADRCTCSGSNTRPWVRTHLA
jgi:hypothetical protein